MRIAEPQCERYLCNMKKAIYILTLLLPFKLWSIEPVIIPADTIINLDEVSVTSIKQKLNLYGAPLSSTTINIKDIENQKITSIKDASINVPNFYIPDYGSRMTSSIYVRGLGARIDQPVIGLNIDNVAFINKNSFDLEVMDIERMEILRGPQSTLYGRNTMGGVVNVHTLSPFKYQGVRIGTEYSSGNSYSLRASAHEKLSDKFAATLGVFHTGSDGFYTNLYTGEKCEHENSWGGRMKLQYYASSKTFIENTFSLSTLDQGGYAYKNLETNEINYNDPSFYNRTSLNNGLTINHYGKSWKLSSVTAYQYLNDEMILDQDFTTASMFTLKQAIQNHSISEDIVLKSNDNKNSYNFLFGVFGFYDHKNMQAPVKFKEDGIDYLIFDNVNGESQYYNNWDNNSFDLYSNFTNQTFGTALYHESSYKNKRLELSAGVRVDFEKTQLDYHCYTTTGCYGNIEMADNNIYTFYKLIDIDIKDTPSQYFFEVLPKFDISYKLGANEQSMIYGSISKGYKAGGYNSQMFSDILQQKVMQLFGLSASYSAEDIISYKPEYSWNYELGTHLEATDNKLSTDFSVFYIDCRDQQLTVFPDGMVTGRMMTNAGHSRSYGVEFSGRATLGNFNFTTSYGYTNAKFISYDDNEEDYSGNYIPYAPKHTLFASADYTVNVNHKLLKGIMFNINTNGAGGIYWNEQNSLSQSFYALLGTEVKFEGNNFSLSLWGKNICNKEYNTFYFLSMGNEFVQQARPRTFGITLNLNI
ncbi:MAG: TonB-dependent receptor [Rikenellaceae bacterium]